MTDLRIFWIPCALAMGLAGCDSAEDSVWVAKSDGSKSCVPESGNSLDEGADVLAAAGVRVLDRKKSNDGLPRIQMCGADTGSLNAYRVMRSDLKNSEKAGFSHLPDESQPKKTRGVSENPKGGE